MAEKICLNLGCGYDIRREAGVNWINCDLSLKSGPDKIVDITKPLPFEDDYADYILCKHILEHTHNFVEVMFELHRVLKPSGILEIHIPEFPCRAAVQDPTHCKFLLLETFLMFCSPQWYRNSNFVGVGLFDVDGVLRRIKWQYPNETEEEAGEFFTEVKIRLKKVHPEYWQTATHAAPQVVRVVMPWKE